MSSGDRSHLVRFGALALSTRETAVESQGVGAGVRVKCSAFLMVFEHMYYRDSFKSCLDCKIFPLFLENYSNGCVVLASGRASVLSLVLGLVCEMDGYGGLLFNERRASRIENRESRFCYPSLAHFRHFILLRLTTH